jgi:hypothetical protein
MIRGLQDPAFIQQREQEAKSFLESLRAKPETAKFVSAWEQVAVVQKKRAEIAARVPRQQP